MGLKVVIDDERTFPGKQLHLRRYEEAFAFIADIWVKQQMYSLIYDLEELWLDHDLGKGRDDLPQSVLPIVTFLVLVARFDAPLRAERIFVHSMNPVGRADIAESLSAAGYNAATASLPEGSA